MVRRFDLGAWPAGREVGASVMSAVLLAACAGFAAPIGVRVLPARGRVALMADDWFSDPIGSLKKNVAKVQAGQYDEAAVRARLDGAISSTPCLVYSFRK